jgi:two-component system alkaline phosphatase synthesis response regulator PhoP
MKGRIRVMVVEDEEAIMLGLVENLKAADYEVVSAGDGIRALKLAQESSPDVMILDLMLPGMSGYEVCRELRGRGLQMPIVMLTARQEEFDKLHGFEMGADDYVTKPFSINELLARIKAILARGRTRSAGPRRYGFGDFTLDLDTRLLTRRGKTVTLTRTEFELLAYFCRNEGKALSREAVMNDVWGSTYFGTQRSLDSFVANLRAKIEAKASKPTHILTVHGVGYKFVREQQ